MNLHPAIPDLHAEYNQWSADLQFYQEEISRFDRRLQTIAQQGYGVAFTAGVHRFRKRFRCEANEINECQQRLQDAERNLAAFVKEVSGLGLGSIRFDNHPQLRQEVQAFQSRHRNRKAAFRRFVAGHR